MTLADIGWYARRLRGMSLSELAWRTQTRARQEMWVRRGVAGSAPRTAGPLASRTWRSTPTDLSTGLPQECRAAIIDAAERLLVGHYMVLGVNREDIADPDWALDPLTGRAFPTGASAFRLDFRSSTDGPDVKQVWELSRHHHLTLLACAWRLSGDERYAATVARQLESWWADNPPLLGINWASGIELGIRLIAWAWIRRLLDGWGGAAALFDTNDMAAHQIYWHQRYLSTFFSQGSSANNHVVAEASGLLVGACAFAWFPESDRWRAQALSLFEREIERNTFTSGVNREQAFDYHGLVAELALAAASEAEAAGAPVSRQTWAQVCAMIDVTAAVLDRRGNPPRYGDADDGRALVVDDPEANRWLSLLASGAAVFGPMPWWPSSSADAKSLLLADLLGHPIAVEGRPQRRPSHFADAGLTLLRSPPRTAHEWWCRCDGGPHGHLAIAAHAHADALSFELRYDGVELLVDPGTYCYHGSPRWRAYFRSTIAHNTIEVDGQNQSVSGGPFLWTRAASTALLGADGAGSARVQTWAAEHDGYCHGSAPTRHRRTVALRLAQSSLRILDHVSSPTPHDLRLAFHFAPGVEVSLGERTASLRWEHPQDGEQTGRLILPADLEWSSHRGRADPIVGWYSSSFGRREPSTALVGTIRAAELLAETRLEIPSVTTRAVARNGWTPMTIGS